MGRRYDLITLDYGAQRRSADGSLVVRGRFARTGLQTYRNEDGSERIEYRAPDEVSSSAPTFEGVAVTDTHPAGMVNAKSWSSLARGHVQNISLTSDGPDGESWLEGDFHFKDAALIDRIERGERPELSAGYFCDEDATPGEYRGKPYHFSQRGITGNHVASIPGGTARAGREARLLLDSNGNQIPPDGGVEKETKNMDEHETKLVALTSERDQLKARTDALTAEVDQLKAKLAEANDPKRIDAAVRARFDLVDRARKLGGAEMDVSGSDADIRVRALNAVGVKVDGRSDAYVEARMDAELERIDSENTVADAIDTAPHGQPAEADWLQSVWDARDRMIADQLGEED